MIHGNACFAYFNKIWGIPTAIVLIMEPGRNMAGTMRTKIIKPA